MNKYTLSQIAAIYTVYKDININYTVNCCTCGKSIHIEQIEDCFSLYGHYISRSIEPKLKFHPYNTHAQCPECNMKVSSDIDKKYDEYMVYRYGKNIKEKLLKDNRFSDINFTKNFYTKAILKLSFNYPELKNIVNIDDSGIIVPLEIKKENEIVEQWYTFSKTYKQDLDTLVRYLKSENIEYERL